MGPRPLKLNFSSFDLIAAVHAVVLSDSEGLVYWSYRYVGAKSAFSMNTFLVAVSTIPEFLRYTNFQSEINFFCQV